MENYSFKKCYGNLLPPGYRFRPTKEELVEIYLANKVLNKSLPPNNIKEVDIYNYNPQELYETYKELGEPSLYFFTPRNRRYPNGSRPNRSTKDGYWKATGADKAVGKEANYPFGYERSLVYYHGKPSNSPIKTDWLMREYTLNHKRFSSTSRIPHDDLKFDDFVLSKIYKKPKKSKDGEQEENGVSNSIMRSAAMVYERPLLQIQANMPHYSEAMSCSSSQMIENDRKNAFSMPHVVDKMTIGSNAQSVHGYMPHLDPISQESSSQMVDHNEQNVISLSSAAVVDECPLLQTQPNMPRCYAMSCEISQVLDNNGQHVVSMPHPTAITTFGSNVQSRNSLPDAIPAGSNSQMFGYVKQNAISVPESNQNSLVGNKGQDSCDSIWPTDEEINKVRDCNVPNRQTYYFLLDVEKDCEFDFSGDRKC